MKSTYDLVVVLPIGPNDNPDFIADTIESIKFYCRCNLKLIFTDDSQQGLGELIKSKYPDADNLVNIKSNGLGGGLYITLALAFKHAVENYHFKTLLRIDTDALVIGENPQLDAEKLFRENPNFGLGGLLKFGNEIIDFNNNVFDNRWPRNYMYEITSTWRVFKRPVANFALRKHFLKAFANGFNIGDNIFGGAYFLSESLLIAMNKAGLLPDYKLKNSRMEEDHIFSLLAKVVNFDIGEMGAGELPFGVYWKKLPASPKQLLAKKKKIIHSTRSWENMNEHDIRGYFSNIRNAVLV